MISHYDVLEVQASVSADDLRASYLAKARKHHPDRQQQRGTEATNEEFQAVQLAWETLRDPDRRAAYDRLLATAGAPRSAAASTQGPTQGTRPTPPVHVWMEVALGDLELGVDDDEGIYTYPCRCGEVFEVTEEDVAERLEIFPCVGCSLQIRVLLPPEPEPSSQSSSQPPSQAS